eukprot:g7656.t2
MGVDKAAPAADIYADKPSPPPYTGHMMNNADPPSAPPPYQPSSDAPGFLAAQSLLGKGVKVALVKDSSGSAKGGNVREYGILTCVAADIKFAAKKPKVRFSTTYLSNVSDVELYQNTKGGQSEVTCRIAHREGAVGSSYTFACTDAAGEFSSSEMTTFVSLVLRDKLAQLQDRKESGHFYVPPPASPKPRIVRPPMTFEELLEPLGLVDKYCEAFKESRIPFQNLSVVTREDLAELVGVTERLDQINITAQIKRSFPDQRCHCNGGSDRRSQVNALAIEGAAKFAGALVFVVLDLLADTPQVHLVVEVMSLFVGVNAGFWRFAATVAPVEDGADGGMPNMDGAARNPSEQFEAIARIMNLYLLPTSPAEINISSEMRERIMCFSTRAATLGSRSGG